MNAKTRQTIYVVMAVLYSAVVACVQQNVFPAKYAMMLGAAEIVLAALMKEFHAPDAEAK